MAGSLALVPFSDCKIIKIWPLGSRIRSIANFWEGGYVAISETISTFVQKFQTQHATNHYTNR